MSDSVLSTKVSRMCTIGNICFDTISGWLGMKKVDSSEAYAGTKERNWKGVLEVSLSLSWTLDSARSWQ